MLTREFTAESVMKRVFKFMNVEKRKRIKTKEFIVCAFCKKEFINKYYHFDIKFCSKKCSGSTRRTTLEKKCLICYAVFKPTSSNLSKGMAHYCSRRCYGIYKQSFINDKNSNWKGDKVGYAGIHKWVSRHLGKPITCEHCRKTGFTGQEIHWANKSQQYKRDLSDWLRLCASCHKIYDLSFIKK